MKVVHNSYFAVSGNMSYAVKNLPWEKVTGMKKGVLLDSLNYL